MGRPNNRDFKEPDRPKFVLAKVDPTFKDMLLDVAATRLKDRKDGKLASTRLLTKKITKLPIWDTLKTADFIKDESAQFSFFGIFNIVIMALVVVLFFGGLIYVTGLLNTAFINVGVQNDIGSSHGAAYVNLTVAAQNTFGQMNSSIQNLRLVALTLIFSMIMATFVVNALVKVHPAFFFVHILVTVLAVIFSATISNAYQSLLQAQVYGGLLQSFTGSSWILLNLPMIVGFVGTMGAVFLFINLESNQGSTVVTQ